MPFGEVELFVREKRLQVIERYAVPYIIGVASVDIVDFYQREEFFSLLGWTNWTFHYISRFQSEETYLRL
ncbi:hypothetical protein SDC9_195047 [bioreactor metagenome]|uniref:Uncharacterized protein n=1 Tax=bioreactor metagenome TaxID=1076179 RepID=A0A645I7X9_9ZZZZ